MRRTVLLTLAATLGLAASASARYYVPVKGHACKAGFVRRDVKIRERHNGKLVRKHGRVVWVRQSRCYSVAPKPTGTPSPGPTPTPTPTLRYATKVDPSFTQAADDPLAVTYAYTADATVTTGTQTVDLAQTNQLPAGVLNLYSPTAPGQAAGLVCSMNVGDATSGGDCPVNYQATGTYQVTTQYIPNAASAVTQTDTEQIDPYPTSAVEQVSVAGGQITVTPQVLGQDGNPFKDQQVEITVTDEQNGQHGPYDGTGTLTFTETFAGNQLELVFSPNYSGNPLAVSRGDTLDIVTRYLGSTGYAASASPTVQTTVP